MKQISYGQLIMLLFVSRIFKMMTYNPLEYVSAQKLMTELVLSTLIQAFIILPLIFIYKKYPGEDVVSLAKKKNITIGNIIGAVYAIYFVLVALKSVKYFAIFMSQMFPVIRYSTVVAIILTIVGGYGALLGIESIGRSATIVFVFFCLMFVAIIATTNGNIDLFNITYAPKNQEISMWTFIIKGIGFNVEFASVAILLPAIKNRLPSGMYIYLGMKLIIIEILVFLSVCVLGAYSELSVFPFFKIGAYSKTQFFERFDALYMFVWALCAVASVAFFIYLVTASIKTISIKAKPNIVTLIIMAVTIVVSVIFKMEKSITDVWFQKYMDTALVLVLVFVIPLIVLLVSSPRKQRG